MPSDKVDLRRLIAVLSAHHVDFVVVGGVAAVLNGAPVTTLDLDVVHQRSPENSRRLLEALEALGATCRGQGDRVILPSVELLSGPGHHLFRTAAGPLDVLGAVGNDRGFEELQPHSRRLRLDDDTEVEVLDLPMLIATKEEANRERDRAVLPILRRALAERDRGAS